MRPLATALLLSFAIAAPAADPAATDAEETFRREAASALAPVTDRYLTALASLARKLERSGKSGSARAVSAELERVRDARDAGTHPLDTLPGLTSGTPEKRADLAPPGAGDIFLSPEQADLEGALAVHEQTKILRRFHGERDVATWTLTHFTPGIYDLVLDYACPEPDQENAGGGSLTITAAGARTTVEIEPLGTKTTFRRTVVGGVALTSPPVSITIRPAGDAPTHSGVFRLRTLVLKPR